MSRTPTPSSTPSPSPRPSPTAAANPGGLTDAELVGQLFSTYVYGSGADVATPDQRAANMALYGAATPADVVRRWHLGGVILVDRNPLDPRRPTLSTGNVDAAAQITALTAGLQRAAVADSGVRLLISTDQEGGRVQRITDGVSDRPAQLTLAHVPPAALTCGYYTLGRQLLALGVNQDFAPDADVVTTAGGVIGDRSFGSDPQLDARDVVAAVRGLQAAGVLATLKHWPGHGSTSTDSHAALAVIEESAATWHGLDRVPFAAAAQLAAGIMVGHLALPALDPSGRPATFSEVLDRHLLRGELGFRGLVITDSLWMEPAQAEGTPGQVALGALRAGNDVLLEPPALPASYTALLEAVHHDAATRKLVQRAVARILAAKARAGAADGAPPGCA
ncbi:MAG: beta-N-acetylhexosaminidase [Nocardioidaceae bacterium]|nr:beta-N-acetylhexosaminidase [Nocardioidaceae bacterium]